MTNKQSQQRYEIGMVGLGVMGRNFLLNMADYDFSVAGYDKDPAKVAALCQEDKQCDARGVDARHAAIRAVPVPASPWSLWRSLGACGNWSRGADR